MEDLWENWISSLEMGGDDHSFGQSHMNSLDEDNFLTEIVEEQPGFSLESAYHSSTMQHNNNSFTNINVDGTATTSTVDSSLSPYDQEASFDEEHDHNNMLKSNNNSSNSIIISQDAAASAHKPAAAAPISQTTYISSLDHENSTIEPALHSPVQPGATATSSSSILCKKTTLNNHVREPRARFRSSSETQEHIMAERKRRQVLTERFVALSATIPGLKKTDKAYILREAISYVKQLQERVKELENQNKRKKADSVIFIKKSQATSCKENSDSGHRFNKALPHVVARALEKEILIEIHCEKQKDIVLRIMALLQNLHLSLAGSSVLPFGTSTLKVTIIAQMDDEYCMTVNDLVKNLRQDLLKSHDIQKYIS